MSNFQAMILFLFGLGVLAICGIVALHYIQAKTLSNLTNLVKDHHKDE
ncbi:MAG: hypothetical protein JHC38_10855 [Thiotrichales bacterium]|nr:hypothetical protein [Thiotrichales bacterium]